MNILSAITGRPVPRTFVRFASRSLAAHGILFLIQFMTTVSTRAASWEQLPNLPEPAGGFACGTLGDKLVCLGGTSWKNEVKIWRDSIWTFDPIKKTWNTIGKMPEPMAYTAFGQLDADLYVSGGSDGKKTHGSLWHVDVNLRFKEVQANACPLVYSGCAVLGDLLFTVGGSADAADFTNRTNGFFAIDLRSGRTRNLPTFPGGKWILPATAAVKEQIYTFTGADIEPAGKAINTNAAFVYSVKGTAWRPIKPYPLAVRGLAACALDQRYILLGGGYRDDFVDDAFLYDTRTDTYTRTVNLPYRAMSSLVKMGNFVYWLGGEDKQRHRSDLAYRIRWKDLVKGL